MLYFNKSIKNLCLVAYLVFIFLSLPSCKSEEEIPDIALITDIIFETIKQDSLNPSVPININLVNRYIYNLQQDSVFGYLPPPPRNEKGEAFVFRKYFGNKGSDLEFNKTDSIFVTDQILLNKDIKINIDRIPKNIKTEDFPVLDYTKQDVYIFLVPIFNKDKSLAIVQYDYYCAGCGYGMIVFFRNINNKWVKVLRATAWIE